MKFKKLPNFRCDLLVILIFTLTSPGFSRISADFPRECAYFYSRILLGHSLSLQDGDVIGNFEEEYITSKTTWDIHGTWSVSEGCELQACKDMYLGGRCRNLNSSSFSPYIPSMASIMDLSARCTCERECSCGDAANLRQENWVCARAYFHPRGCNNCNSEYTQLVNSSESFPEEWRNRVRSFLIKPGCNLTLYDEEGYDGEANILGENFVENWNGTVGSYSCQCDFQELNVSDDIESVEDKIKIDAYNDDDEDEPPLQVAVPDSLDEIVSMIRRHNYAHPGLRAAFYSSIKGRSSKNAYILIIGSTGAGKSRLINNLLGDMTVTKVGHDQSTTSEIHEYRIPVPLKELGLANTQLRIIDTPGLGDTRGVEQDALFLSTLDEYLSGHEELRNRIPNLVLILHPFTDNRFNGEGAKFVSMIRGLDYFRTRLTDKKFSNVLFLFSHLCSSTKPLQRNPSSRLWLFKEVIKEFTLLPQPIQTGVLENLPKENELVMINGNYKLPNNELFPRNLLERFHKITGQGGDLLGQAIINSAFNQTSIQQLNISETTFPLVNRNHNKVPTYLDILTVAKFSLGSPQVSKKLSQAFETMNDTLKSEYPESLNSLQKFLNIRNIRTLADIPLTTTSIVKLLQQLELNPANVYLLEEGLDLRAPTFPQNIVAGFSHSILKDVPLPKSPYQLGQPQLSNIGFMFPKDIECTKTSGTRAFSLGNIFDTKEDYVRARIQGFVYNVSILNDINIFTGLRNNFVMGINSKDVSCSNNRTCSFVVSRYFDIFKLDLKEDAQFSSEFLERVGNLSAFNETNYEVVESWRNFFDEYGTHVVSSAGGGGRIDIRIETPFPPPNTIPLLQNAFKTVEFAEDISKLITGQKFDPKHLLENVSCSLTFHGGSAAYHTSDLTKLPLEEASSVMKKWKMSLRVKPVIRASNIVSLHEKTKLLGQGISEKIEQATLHLLNSTLKYVPPPTLDPAVEVERIRKVNEANEKKLAEKLKHLEDKAEQELEAWSAARQRREEVAKERQQLRLEEMVEIRRNLEEERRRHERQMELEEQMSAEERARLSSERDRELERIFEWEREFQKKLVSDLPKDMESILYRLELRWWPSGDLIQVFGVPRRITHCGQGFRKNKVEFWFGQ